MESPLPSGTTRRRVELRLRRPWCTWGARPTVTVDGVGQPAQWGTGTWALGEDGTELGVYCYNRAWRFGAAALRVDPAAGGEPLVIEYRAGLLPVGRGTLRILAA
jgi:hypothetical protein